MMPLPPIPNPNDLWDKIRREWKENYINSYTKLPDEVPPDTPQILKIRDNMPNGNIATHEDVEASQRQYDEWNRQYGDDIPGTYNNISKRNKDLIKAIYNVNVLPALKIGDIMPNRNIATLEDVEQRNKLRNKDLMVIFSASETTFPNLKKENITDLLRAYQNLINTKIREDRDKVGAYKTIKTKIRAALQLPVVKYPNFPRQDNHKFDKYVWKMWHD